MAEQSNEALTFIGSGIYADKAQQQLEAIGKEKETLDKLKVSNEKLQEEFNAIDFLSDPTKTPEKDKEVKYLDSYLQQKAIKKSEQDILDTITQSQLNAQKWWLI